MRVEGRGGEEKRSGVICEEKGKEYNNMDVIYKGRLGGHVLFV